ncbi:pheA operon leader peptide PheL [Klebsiella oxytoca]|nr:pheA operon leader peptide PheL [Klebsiella oxytoca]
MQPIPFFFAFFFTFP